MKNQFLTLKVVLSVSLIVLSIAVPVNHRLAGGLGSGNSLADGVPLPPPIQPTPKLGVVETADGVPLPPPIQPTPKNSVALIADGVPLPPPIQPTPKLNNVLVADGVPLPPPIQPTPKLVVA
ncbi:MAG TPA: hypothetical protein VGR58_06980 [Candidatus Acidoferrum sp.]|nr:hypothetical protein [Candidatus Acidoferrum sp.]